MNRNVLPDARGGSAPGLGEGGAAAFFPGMTLKVQRQKSKGNVMEMVLDQWAKLNEANLNATLRCAAVSTEAARRLCELQIQAIGKAWTEGAEGAVAFARDGDVFKALRVWPSLCDAGLHQMAQLPQMAIEMTTQAQAEILKAVNEDLALMARMMTENLKALTQPAAAEGASDGAPAVQSSVEAGGAIKPARKR